MQISLYFLALLDRAHIDGFLCDKTVEALNIFAEIWPLDEEVCIFYYRLLFKLIVSSLKHLFVGHHNLHVLLAKLWY